MAFSDAAREFINEQLDDVVLDVEDRQAYISVEPADRANHGFSSSDA